MILKARGGCSCGVTVSGDLDEDSREFIHRFSVPPGAAILMKARVTEVAEGIRLVTFPLLRSALFAGALLAFALSFDEIVVTTFTAGPGVQTLPIWIFSNLFRPNQAPVINVVASVLIVLSVVPVWLAQRMGSGETAGGRL